MNVNLTNFSAKNFGVIHFCGIGGIGMSGIAEIMNNLGYNITGSDQANNSNVKRLKKNGIKHNKIIIDPGIGFGKNLKHNINLISNISIFHSLGFPILVGNSKKRFIKEIAGKNDTKNRIGGTVASSIYLMMQGVQILRIHDVNELLQGIKVFKKIINH